MMSNHIKLCDLFDNIGQFGIYRGNDIDLINKALGRKYEVIIHTDGTIIIEKHCGEFVKIWKERGLAGSSRWVVIKAHWEDHPSKYHEDVPICEITPSFDRDEIISLLEYLASVKITKYIRRKFECS